MVDDFSETIKEILNNSTNGAKHILHLYSSSVNKYAIHASFLSKKEEATAYITCEKADEVLEQFEFLNPKLSVIHPFRLEKLTQYKNVIIDAATISPKLLEEKSTDALRLKNEIVHKRKTIGQDELIKSYVDHIEREKYLSELKHKPCILCTYNMSTLEPDKLKHLIETHDKLILTTDDTIALSSKSFSSKNLKLDNEILEQFVKNELHTIVLALVSSNQLCGNDIKKKIYEKFNILLSSGTLYPLLHKLESDGLLACTYGIKTKTYKIANEEEVKKMLNDSVQAKKFLNSFIQNCAQSSGGGRVSEKNNHNCFSTIMKLVNMLINNWDKEKKRQNHG